MFVIIVYFTYISQGSVKTHLWCSGIYHDHIIANCPQSVPAKKFEDKSITGKYIDKRKMTDTFLLAHRVYNFPPVTTS